MNFYSPAVKPNQLLLTAPGVTSNKRNIGECEHEIQVVWSTKSIHHLEQDESEVPWAILEKWLENTLNSIFFFFSQNHLLNSRIPGRELEASRPHPCVEP